MGEVAEAAGSSRRAGPQLKPVLVMGVYRGGRLLAEALESLRPCARAFEKIVISVNNSDPVADVSTATGILDPSNRIILTTGQNLSPVNHHIWLVDRLREKFASGQVITLLCHDDLVRSEAILALASKGGWGLRADEVVLGDYEVFGENPLEPRLLNEKGFASCFLGSIRDREDVGRMEWFRNLAVISHGFTNVSGMMVPLRILISTARFLRATRGTKGCRMEYMLVSHRSVKTIRRFRNPIVSIRLHKAQESAAMSSLDLLSDEIRYCLWLYINARTPADWIYQLQGPQGLANLYRLLRKWADERSPRSPSLALLVRCFCFPFKVIYLMARIIDLAIRSTGYHPN